jgi:alkylhydroperoxidase family enzyme
MTRAPADISNELFEELRKRFSNAQLVELTTAIAHANFRARFNRPFNIQPTGFSAGANSPVLER